MSRVLFKTKCPSRMGHQKVPEEGIHICASCRRIAKANVSGCENLVPPQRCQRGFKILRRRGGEVEAFAGGGVLEAEVFGMEGLAV